MKKINNKTIHILILLLGSIFICLSIFHTSLWFDETYSVGMANHSLVDIWKIGGNDVHPVLYYWLLRIVCLITGGSILAYRIFSAIPIILLGVIGYTHIRKDFGEKTGMLFSFLALFIPVSTVYANQIRMYSWAALILTLFFIYSYRLYKGEHSFKNWLIFFGLSLCSIYIHYYGLMAAGITNVLLLLFFIKNKDIKSIRNIVISGIVQLVLYIPWLIYFVGQLEHVSDGFWIELQLEDKLKILASQYLIGESLYPAVVLAVILLVYLIISLIRKRKEIDIKPVIFAIIIYLLVIIGAIVVEKVLKTPILYHRYLFVVIGLYIFAFSYMLSKENNKYIVAIVCLAVLCFGIANCVYQVKHNYNKENLEAVNFFKENLKEDDEIIYRHIGAGSIVAVNFNNKQYFYNPEDWKVKKAYKAYGPQMQTYITDEFKEDFGNRVWVIDTYDDAVYDEFFNNDEYKVITETEFSTDYNECYKYKIRLVERN